MSDTPTTGRLQLALNVTDLEASVQFYSDLFGQGPAKRKDGYANFAIAEPPLKLILFAGSEGGTINHLGVEVATSEEVDTAIDRLSAADMPLLIEEKVTCCYATQNKAWATAPDGERWEYYTVIADAETLESDAPTTCSCTDDTCACDETTPVGSAACCTAVA